MTLASYNPRRSRHHCPQPHLRHPSSHIFRSTSLHGTGACVTVAGSSPWHGTGACVTVTHAPVPLIPFEKALTEPARVALACFCVRADFVRPDNKVIEHKVLCVCVLGPCFMCVLVFFCSRGDLLVGTNTRHPVSSQSRRGFWHVRTRTHWVMCACDLFPW